MSSERRATSGELKAASRTEPAAKRRKRIGAKRAPEGRKKHTNQEKTKELRLPKAKNRQRMHFHSAF
jgi:hypothetical protein